MEEANTSYNVTPNDYKVIISYDDCMWIMPLNVETLNVLGIQLKNCWGNMFSCENYLPKGPLVLVENDSLKPICQNTIAEIKSIYDNVSKFVYFRGYWNAYVKDEVYQSKINDIIEFALNTPSIKNS